MTNPTPCEGFDACKRPTDCRQGEIAARAAIDCIDPATGALKIALNNS